MSAELTGRPYSSLEEMLDASGGDFLEKVVSGPEISAHMLSGRNVFVGNRNYTAIMHVDSVGRITSVQTGCATIRYTYTPLGDIEIGLIDEDISD